MTGYVWFDAATVATLAAGGAIFSAVWAGTVGLLSNVLANKGRGKPVMYGLLCLGLAAGICLIAAGIFAILCRQPSSILAILFAPGGALLFAAIVTTRPVMKAYQTYELRQIQAANLR